MKIFVKVNPKAKEEKVEKIDGINFKVSVTQSLEKGRVSSAVIRALADYFHISQSDMRIIPGSNSKLKIIEKLKINPNISTEIIENLKDIYKKDEAKIVQFMQNIDNMNVEEIRENLKSIKFPNLSKKEAQFDKISKILKNKYKNSEIKHFPYFEKEEYEINLKFYDFKELENWIKND